MYFRYFIDKVSPKTYPSLFYGASINSKTRVIYFKVVNAAPTNQPITLDFKVAANVKSKGKLVVLKADKPEGTNTITEPEKIVPTESFYKGFKKSFIYTFPKYSISILQIATK